MKRGLSGKDGASFEIFSEKISEKKKKSSLVFIAETEKELQEWLIPLKVLVGIDSAFRTTSPVAYVNSGLRDKWLSEINIFGDTALHVAARFYNGASPVVTSSAAHAKLRRTRPVLQQDRPQVPLVRLLQLCMWLVESGCPINAQNDDGQTALHVAVQFHNTELVSCLIKKGANPKLRDRNNSTPEYFANSAILAEIRTAVSATESARSLTLLPPAVKITGYSYLTLHFQKHALSARFADRYVANCLILLC